MGLNKIVVEEIKEGKWYRGRPCLQYTQQVIYNVNCKSYVDIKKKTEKGTDF